jgi:2-polyprenyl-6-methoxyphenol hydroxylase-like FAD-dependent oxidoreductase
MARIIVLGGGIVGLSMGMMLRDDAHDVTVLERDREAPPTSVEDAWASWDRRGVGQFRQPHYLLPAGRLLLEQELPEVATTLYGEGGTPFEVLQLLPATVADRTPRPGDERLFSVGARRPVLEHAVAGVAGRLLDVRRGVSVSGVLTGTATANGVPHVTGVRLASGETIHADLVIDAMGRTSPAPDWLEGIGARRPLEEAEDQGFIYYSRYFRTRTGKAPEFRTSLLTHLEAFSILSLPTDAQGWSMTVYIFAGDQALKKLRDLDRWTALLAACPRHAHLLDGTPLTDLVSLGGILDRRRRFVVDGAPVVTGLVAVGDAWACTNPSLGRGITMGLIHAAGTREVVRCHLDDPLALARAHDEMTERRLTPWYRNTVELDRVRRARLAAAAEGRALPEPSDPAARIRTALPIAAQFDADLFRAFIEMTSLLALPSEVMARPGLTDRILEVAGRHPPPAPLGPSRAETLRILA